MPTPLSTAPTLANATNTLLGSSVANEGTLLNAGYRALNGGLQDIKTGQMLPGIQYNPGETQILADPNLIPNILQQFRGITSTSQTPNEAAGIPPIVDPNAVPGGQDPNAPQASTVPLPPPPPQTPPTPTYDALGNQIQPGQTGVNPQGINPTAPPPSGQVPQVLQPVQQLQPIQQTQAVQQPQIAQAPQNQTSLVDIWDSRLDLQQAFPNKGKGLDDWWNLHGVREYPNTQLVAPGTAGIRNPKELEAQATQTNIAEPIHEVSTTTPVDFQENPIRAYTQLYTDVLKASGVATFKAEYEKLADEMAGKVADELNNPWLVESIKNARIKKIQDKYDTKLSLYKTLYDQGMQEAHFITNGAYNAYADKTKSDATALQNATQNAIDLAKLQSGSEMTTDMKEYALYIEQGGSGSFIDYQREVANLKRSSTNIFVGGSGLDSKTLTQVQGIANSFDNEQVVKNYNVIAEGYNFVRGLSDKSTNPADDQALIYALAKALDPNSVVREGEYATAQKYAQSWVKAYGKTVTQALQGKGFLSEEARRNIKTTIGSRFQASKQNYDNVYNEYGRRINNITGSADGLDYLTNYGGAYSAQTTSTDTSSIISDIQSAIHDTSNWATREDLIPALANEYGISLDEAANYVYSNWSDNASR